MAPEQATGNEIGRPFPEILAPETEGGSEPIANYGSVKKVSDTVFMFEHKTD